MTLSARELYAQVGIGAIPKLLGLLDRNRLSPTYGCFDKAFWHYRTASFPSGMFQEYVLPLALVYAYQFPGGEDYYQRASLKSWVRAGIQYASKSAHRDGSCDDYFPYERALGAVVFSLYACTESALLLGLRDSIYETFFVTRGQWLLAHDEAGRLANRHALAVLALYNVYLLSGQTVFQQGAQARLERLLSWQSSEGWFPEYEGCDPGYHTASIDFLAKYYQKSGDTRVLEPLSQAVRFAADFIHPDGSFGGAYGSRNTCLFFPHGFELLGLHTLEATWIADRYLQGVRSGRRVFLEDDRLIAHLTYNHLQAFLDYCPQRQQYAPSDSGTQFWKGAGLYVHRQGRHYAVISVAKGGVIKLFEHDRLCYTDSGLIARLHSGRCLVSHLLDRYEYQVQGNVVRVKGYFGYVKHRTFTSLSMLGFYALMLTLGRFGSNLVRALLQRVLIVGKRPAPLVFQRTFQFCHQVTLIDELWDKRPRRRGKERLTALYAGTDHTSIYVAMSNAYQATCLEPWTDYTPYLAQLRHTGYVKIMRPLMGGDMLHASPEDGGCP
jgi:hypothetical protein